MRMDQTAAGETAATLLNSWDEADLAALIRTYGEERFATAIARAVVRERGRRPMATTAAASGAGRADHPPPLLAKADPPRHPNLPGAPHRGQPRAGEPPSRAAGRHIAPPARWASWGHLLPLSRGLPCKERTPRRSSELSLSAPTALLHLRSPGLAPPPHPQGDPTRRRGTGGEPQVQVGSPPGGGEAGTHLASPSLRRRPASAGLLPPLSRHLPSPPSLRRRPASAGLLRPLPPPRLPLFRRPLR